MAATQQRKVDLFFALKAENGPKILAHIAENPVLNTQVYFGKAFPDDLTIAAEAVVKNVNILRQGPMATANPEQYSEAKLRAETLRLIDDAHKVHGFMKNLATGIFKHIDADNIHVSENQAARIAHVINQTLEQGESFTYQLNKVKREVMAQNGGQYRPSSTRRPRP